MKNSHEYPSYADPEPDTWDDAADDRAAKDREFIERDCITQSQAAEPVRAQEERGNAWGWMLIGASIFWLGVCAAYTMDVYWTKQIESSFTEDFINERAD